MDDLRFTLLADGASDRALLPVLSWVLRTEARIASVQPRWADLRCLRNPPRTLTDRMRKAVELYPGDLLFVHRDSEREPAADRREEIGVAAAAAEPLGLRFPVVAVVPVRMTEAWLLFDEAAIRLAAGNPVGAAPLDLPPLSQIESLPSPKERLNEVLCAASGLRGRRRRLFQAERLAEARVRIAELTTDWSPLRQLSAFQRLVADVVATLAGAR